MHAFRLAQIDKEYDMHLQAWLNHQVTLTKEQGKKQVPVYTSFKDFYDYEKNIKEIEKHSGNDKVLSERMKRMVRANEMLNERR